jgi:hypothetical protein
MPNGSSSAAGDVSLERLGLCIAGLKQSSARRGETTEVVANRQRAVERREVESGRTDGRGRTPGFGRLQKRLSVCATVDLEQARKDRA